MIIIKEFDFDAAHYLPAYNGSISLFIFKSIILHPFPRQRMHYDYECSPCSPPRHDTT